MPSFIPGEVLTAFFTTPADAPIDIRACDIQPIGDGLIHHSYRVSNGRDVLFLQQLNTNVFQDPALLATNYLAIRDHCSITSQQNLVPTPRLIDRQLLFQDQQHHYWRAFDFIAHSCSYTPNEGKAHATAIAAAFATFTVAFDGFDQGRLHEPIPGFHDLALRYQQFNAALRQDPVKRSASCRELIEQLLQRSSYRDRYQQMIQLPAFRKRVMHHDAKVGNVLFHKEHGTPLCLVDFDTVMPGYFFSDLGDMIRSMTPTMEEDSKALHQIGIATDIYDNLVAGYLAVIGPQLTAAELERIHDAGLFLTYMQALRFLTDHLLGDRYYRVEYAGHNLVRAENQLVLLQQLEGMIQSRFNPSGY